MWAQTKVEKRANGHEDEVPLGSACKACFQHWSEDFRAEASTFSEHARRFRSDQKYKKIVEDSKKSRDGANRSWKPESVDHQLQHSLVVKRKYTVLNEDELRHVLRAPRLNKADTRHLSSVSLPRETPLPSERASKKQKADPEKDFEVCYAFAYDHNSPHRTLEVSSSIHVNMHRSMLDSARNSFAGQGSNIYKSEASAIDSKARVGEPMSKLLTGYLAPLDDFTAKCGSKKKAKSGGGGDSNDESDGGEEHDGDDEGEEEEPCDAQPPKPRRTAGVIVPSPSPGKRRPPVPPFSAVASARPSASAPSEPQRDNSRSMGSVASAVSDGSDGGDGGDRDGGDSSTALSDDDISEGDIGQSFRSMALGG